MTNHEKYKQAFSALPVPKLTLPEARQRTDLTPLRRGVAAAVLCALAVAGTVGAFWAWKVDVAFDGNRKYRVTLEDVDAANAPSTLEQLYCPAALPGNAQLWSVSGDPEKGTAEWEWRMDYTDQYTWILRFRQYTLGQMDLTQTLYQDWNAWATEEVLLGDIPVTRVTSTDTEYDWPIGLSLYWTDGTYGYQVSHNGPQYFSEEEQAALIASLTPVDRGEHARMKEETVLNRLLDCRLEQLWVPAAWEEDLAFTWEPDAKFGPVWAFEDSRGYSVRCRQRHIASKQQGSDAQTQYEMAWDWRREVLELGGKQVFTVGTAGGSDRGEIYYLADKAVLCMLTVDDELAQQLGLTREELAARVLETMTLMDRAQAEGALAALETER